MSLTLTIDQGNSAAKLAIWDGLRLLSVQLCHPLTEDDIQSLLAQHDISAAIYCSVTDRGENVIGWLRSRGVAVTYLTADTPLPISLGYTTPATLGRDRIAAAVGAWHRHPGRSILVVDIGTAITYDVVDSTGCFIGGNIAPGPWMRLQSLHHFTARLPEVDERGDVCLWGRDTAAAMRAGAIYGVVGELTYYRSRLGDDAVTVLTGGDAPLVAPLLDFPGDYEPNLVSEGLNFILRYNGESGAQSPLAPKHIDYPTTL